MENALLVGLTRQLTLRRALDVTANNVANMSTAGFKVERPLMGASEADRPARTADGGSISFVRDWGLARNFTPGQLELTSRPLDVALRGEGFFTVETPEGETRYTRDGRFSVDPDGQLTTAAGHLVLNDVGSPINVPADVTEFLIDDSGAILAGGQRVAQLGVVRFADNTSLDKAGDGTFRSDAPAVAVEDPDVRQGYVEQSNVNPIGEITRLIEVTRAYESVTRMLSSDEDLKRRAIDTLSGAR